MEGEIEIARFHHAEPLALAQKVLAESGVPFRNSDDSLTLDVAALGRGSQAAAILLVPAEHVVAARTALLEAARVEVQASPDDSHFLAAYSDQELLDVIASPHDWSPYDLALAEHFLSGRGIMPPAVDFASRPEVASDLPGELEDGEPAEGVKDASRTMLMASVLFGTMGGIFGLIIPSVFVFWTETAPDGQRRYVYNPRTRRIGRYLLVYSLLVLWAFLVYLLYFHK